MSVKGNKFNIKKSIINPNLSNGLIFHIDSEYSEKNDTSYLYSGYKSFKNLVSDSSQAFSILGTYSQTNITLTSYSSSVTYSFGFNSFNYASGFLYSTASKSYIETNGTILPGFGDISYDYEDIASWYLSDIRDKYSLQPAFDYVGQSSNFKVINISNDRMYHDDNLNRLFIPACTLTNYGTFSLIDENSKSLILVFDTNINKIIGTVSLFKEGVEPGFLAYDSEFSEFIPFSDNLYYLIGGDIYHINRETLVSTFIDDIGNPVFGIVKPFTYNNKNYTLCSDESNFNGQQYYFLEISSTSVSYYTFSTPLSYTDTSGKYWGLTHSYTYSGVPDVDIWGTTWSRVYIPAYGVTSSNEKKSFLFVYGLTDSSGHIGIESTPMNVLEFPNSRVNRAYKIPDVRDKFWGSLTPAANRDRMYLFGERYDIGEWIVSTYTASTTNYLFGVSQSYVTPDVSFNIRNYYNVDFYTGTQGSIDRATYSGIWRWDSDVSVGLTPSNPGTGQFSSMNSSFDGNNSFRIGRRSVIEIGNGVDIMDVYGTFSEFTQIINSFNAGKQVSFKITTSPTSFWIIRKNSDGEVGFTFSPPYTEYVTSDSPRLSYDNLGWKCLNRSNSFFYSNGLDYIRTNITTGAIGNIDLKTKFINTNDLRFFNKNFENNQYRDLTVSGVNANKNVIYTIEETWNSGTLPEFSGTWSYNPRYSLVESNLDISSTIEPLSDASTNSFNIGYITLPNFGWQGNISGLANKKTYDRSTPLWSEGTISLWFYNKNIIGTSSTFESLFSCWDPIKKNQGTTSATGRTFIQMSENTEFFFGFGNFSNNGSILTVKCRDKITYYRPVTSLNPKWYHISVSRSSSGLKVYLDGQRLIPFSGVSEDQHSTDIFINTSGVNEKNVFFLNRRDARVVVGGYRQRSQGTNGGTRTHDNIPINIFNGYFSKIMVWNRELSDLDVKNDFETFRSRYGV